MNKALAVILILFSWCCYSGDRDVYLKIIDGGDDFYILVVNESSFDIKISTDFSLTSSPKGPRVGELCLKAFGQDGKELLNSMMISSMVIEPIYKSLDSGNVVGRPFNKEFYLGFFPETGNSINLQACYGLEKDKIIFSEIVSVTR